MKQQLLRWTFTARTIKTFYSFFEFTSIIKVSLMQQQCFFEAINCKELHYTIKEQFEVSCFIIKIQKPYRVLSEFRRFAKSFHRSDIYKLCPLICKLVATCKKSETLWSFRTSLNVFMILPIEYCICLTVNSVSSTCIFSVWY